MRETLLTGAGIVAMTAVLLGGVWLVVHRTVPAQWIETCTLTAISRGVAPDVALALCRERREWLERQRAAGWR